MTELTHLSLFSGIGGLDLAAEAAGFQTVGQCEWADYPTKVLEKHWPDVPRWRDIRTLTGDDFYARTGRRSVTVISGGFPCQPFSVAGKRRGKEDDRYFWPEMLRIISEIRPSWVIGENVPGIINLALDTVLSDLESQGYACQTFIVPACAVDAPHKRDRVCILGWNTRGGECKSQCQVGKVPEQDAEPSGIRSDVSHTDRDGSNARRAESAGQQRQAGTANGGYDVADTNEQGLQGWQREIVQECTGERTFGTGNTPMADTAGTRLERCTRDNVQGTCERPAGGSRRKSSNGRPIKPELGCMADGIPDWMGGYWPAEPEGIPRIAIRIPHRVDQLKCYGNAVVPQQFYPFFRFIAEIEIAASGGKGEKNG